MDQHNLQRLRQPFEEPTSGYLSALYYEEGEEKDERERERRGVFERGGEANRVIWQGCLLHRGRGIINFNYTTRRERLRGGKAHVINLRQQHRYQTYHHHHHQPTTPHRTHQRLSTSINTVFPTLVAASPSSIRSGITWVLIKRNASHPLFERGWRCGRGVVVEGVLLAQELADN